MTLGLVQYALGRKRLGDAGRHPADVGSPAEVATRKRRQASSVDRSAPPRRSFSARSAIATGLLPVTPTQLSDAAGYFLLIFTVVFFGWLYFSPGWTPAGAQAQLPHRRPLSGRRVVLRRVRAGGLDAQPVRRSLHRQLDRRLGVPEHLVPVAELVVHHRACPGVRVALDLALPGAAASRRARRSSGSASLW